MDATPQPLPDEEGGHNTIRADVDNGTRETTGGCWLDMFLNKPRLRYDGIYVSRNTCAPTHHFVVLIIASTLNFCSRAACM